MLKENFTVEEKRCISNNIKPISLDKIKSEMEQLIQIGSTANNISERSKIGNNIVDYFTFIQRLETKGKYNINYFEFLVNLNTFREKKFIQNMLKYYEDVKNKNKKKNEHTVFKEVYNICISAINIMRPLNCMEIFSKFNATRVLNFCAGWGGSTVAAAALNLDAHYGIEINNDLAIPYNNMLSFLKQYSNTDMQIYITNAVTFDYSKLEYDTVFSSPPYYFIEKYANNIIYNSKLEMDELFYTPIFVNSYKYLKNKGHFVINICKEVYNNVLVKLFGNAHIIFPLKKSKRQNNYTEMVYVWQKNIN